MKIKHLLSLLLLVGCASQKQTFERLPSSTTGQDYLSMFSPWEGKEAFARMYAHIANAKHDVKVTVYSWSDTGFDKALEAAAANGVNIKVVLHPDLAKKPALLEKAKKMESTKARGKIAFKVAPRNMHEKFSVIDSEILVNTSANMSNGAKVSYSENFVFMSGPTYLIENFENEFAVLWNSSKDLISSETDSVEDRLPYVAQKHQTLDQEATLYSSSMNYDYVENDSSTAAYQGGQFVKLKAKGGGKGPYTVRDALISGISKAQKSILCSFNHFNIKEVANALIEASKRGVDVKLTVDNQEYSDHWDARMIEMTPYFVANWKALPGNANKEAPARVKFYSHNPNPAIWLLNHHKFLLIDYDKNAVINSSVLFTGSYNISETAEHNQFDNMVAFRGVKYSQLHKSFFDEFYKLWSLERNNDQPNSALTSYFTTVKDDLLPIHSSQAVSLTWSEIYQMREKIKSVAPEFLNKMIMRTNTCRSYNVKTKTLQGCAPN